MSNDIKTNNKINNTQASLFGLLCLISAQLCSSMNVVVGKHLMEHVTPLVVLTLRFTIGSIFLIIFILLKQQFSQAKQNVISLPKIDKISLFTQSLFSGFLYNMLMLAGVRITSAAMAGILIGVEPALIFILSFFILKEKIKSNQVLAVCIVILGIVALNVTKINAEGLSLNILGDFIVFLAIMPEALYTIVAKKFPVKLEPVVFAVMVNVINSIMFGASLFLFTNDYLLLSEIPAIDWLFIFSVVPVSGFMFFLLWNIGLKYTSAQQAAVVTAVVPVGICVFAVMFLHEVIHMYEIMGVLMVVFAIYIGSRGTKDSMDIDESKRSAVVEV